MALTKEQWTDIEDRLSGFFGAVILMCDGHKVSAYVQRRKGRIGIAVYVDGYMRTEWCKGQAEEACLFLRPKKVFLHSASVRAEYAKKAKSRALSKELQAFFAENATQHFVFWEPWWPNAKDFCRNLRKTCTDVTLPPGAMS